MSRFYSLINIATLLFLKVSFSQEIKGNIYFDGKPLPNVNIKINETKNGTSSDVNGKFKIEVNIGDTLNFSYVGMKIQKIGIKNYKPLKIYMESSVNELQEIVLKGIDKQLLESRKIITRFGEIDMDKVGYTAYAYTGKEIQSFSAIGVAQALAGRVPNLQITNSGVILRPRGFFEKYALWDIDGVLYEGNPPYFDPSTVKSVFVIPSNTSSLSYGSRAAGGVIIVNTYNYFKNNISLKQLDYYTKNDDNTFPKNMGELSEFVESNFSNINNLRVLAFKYEEENNDVFALRLNRYIISKTPHDIKSYRDLANSLIKDRQYRNAWYNYLEYLRIKDNKISDLELNIIINDMERLYHVYGLKKKIKNFSTSKIFSDVKNDIRIVFEWTIPNEKIKIEIINPKKQSVEFTLGSNSNNFEQIDEFFLNGDILGNWIFNAKTNEGSNLNGTLKVTVYKNWLLSSKNKPIKKLFFFRQTKEGYYRLFKMNV